MNQSVTKINYENPALSDDQRMEIKRACENAEKNAPQGKLREYVLHELKKVFNPKWKKGMGGNHVWVSTANNVRVLMIEIKH